MHAGSLPRPQDLREMVVAKAEGRPYDEAKLSNRLTEAVGEVVQLDRFVRERPPEALDDGRGTVMPVAWRKFEEGCPL